MGLFSYIKSIAWIYKFSFKPRYAWSPHLATCLHHLCQISSVNYRDETILQYIDILQYLLLQYNIIWLKRDIDILHIAIYCDILQYIALFVVLML